MVPRTRVTKREATAEIDRVNRLLPGLRTRINDCQNKLNLVPLGQREPSWGSDFNRANLLTTQAERAAIAAARPTITPAAAMKKITTVDEKIEDADKLLEKVLPAVIQKILAPLRVQAERFSNKISKYISKPVLYGAIAAAIYSLVKGVVEFSKEFSTSSNLLDSVWAGLKVPLDMVGQLGHAISEYPVVVVSAIAVYRIIKSIGNILNLRAKPDQIGKEISKLQIANEIVSGITKTAIVSGVTLVAAKLIDNWLYLINSNSVFAPDRMSLFDAIPATLKQISGWVASAPAVLPAGIALGLVIATAIYNKINKKI